jgi:hypothetical protein
MFPFIQIFQCNVRIILQDLTNVGLERGTLSFVRISDELPELKSGFVLGNRD